MPRSRLNTFTVIILAASLIGCAGDGATARARVLASSASRRLVGVWDVRFDLDPSRTVALRSRAAAPVTGTVVFAEDRFGRVSAAGIGETTHEGVYDVSFEPFGFSSRAETDVPVAAARIVSGAGIDSLYVVLSPGTTRLPVRMAGTLAGDSASGTWEASGFSAGGGGGTFLMRRRRSNP